MTILPVSIFLSDPLYWADSTSFKLGLSTRVSAYSQEIAADGGYKTATVTMSVSTDEIGRFVETALGQHIEVYDQSTVKIWEGYVDNITVNLGTLSFSRGPLAEIGNRITALYTDFTTSQPAVTTAQNDTISQERYGIWHKVVSVGSVSATTANSIRNTYLQESKWPESTHSVAFAGGETTLTLTCLGYINWITYPYNEATDTTYTAREKILEVLADDPNTIISTDYNFIETNTLSVARLDNDYRVALEVIKEIVNMGGDADNIRRTFGIYNNRVAYLQAIPQEIEYTMRVGDPVMYDKYGRAIEPWNVRAGKWIKMVDFLPGLNIASTNPREDPRNVFIESVTYTAPADLAINGGKTGTVTQQLSKLGL